MPDDVRTNEVVVTIDQQDIRFTQEQLGVNMDTPDRQVLDAVRGMVDEELKAGLRDQAGEYTFAVRRALNSDTIYVYPKPGFGEIEGIGGGIVRNSIGHFLLCRGEEGRLDEALEFRHVAARDVVGVTWNGAFYVVWHRK